jgi:protein-S-isoprenylcysteine O-methyltransferase Ste14
MKNSVKQLLSFILPITVLILVPLSIENNFRIELTFISIIGLLLMCLGLFVMIWTVSTFIKIGKGTLAPWSPARNFIIEGMYGYVRNPMIMAVLTVLIGESIALLSLNITKWTIIFFVINNIWFVVYEEPNLEKKFGEEYIDYKKNVRRWVPRLKPYRLNSKKDI